MDKRPARKLAVVTCMDCRLDVSAAFGLDLGDAHMLRNAGGIVTDDVLRSLAISQHALGTTAIALVHHTDCGMAGFDDPAFRAGLAADSGVAPSWDVAGFTDVRAAVRHAVEVVRGCPWLPNRDDVSGYVYDVATGAVDPV